MLTYVIASTTKTSLRTKSAWVILKNNTPTTAYRRVEVIMPLAADPVVYIDALALGDLWSEGSESDESAYNAPAEKALIAPVFAPIINKIFGALAGPADLDMIRGQIIGYLQQSPAVYDQFMAAINKLDIDASTDEGKREQLLWAIVMALVTVFNAEST